MVSPGFWGSVPWLSPVGQFWGSVPSTSAGVGARVGDRCRCRCRSVPVGAVRAVGAASGRCASRWRPLPVRAGGTGRGGAVGEGGVAPPRRQGAVPRGGAGRGGAVWAGPAGAGPVRSGRAEVPVLPVPVPPPCTGPCTASARPSPTRCPSLPERPSCCWSAATSTGGSSPAPARARRATRRPPTSSGCRWAGPGGDGSAGGPGAGRRCPGPSRAAGLCWLSRAGLVRGGGRAQPGARSSPAPAAPVPAGPAGEKGARFLWPWLPLPCLRQAGMVWDTVGWESRGGRGGRRHLPWCQVWGAPALRGRDKVRAQHAHPWEGGWIRNSRA